MSNKALIFIFLAILTLTACGQNRNTAFTQNENIPIANESKKVMETPKDLKENECKICDFDFANYKGELKKEEIDGLLLALNDEYLATAIYEQVNKDFANPRPFINIVQAEMKHADTLKALFVNYKLNVPENPWLGNAPKYTSVAEACKAGVDAEIVNRDLYTKLFKSTTREDILTVYRALQRASEENHLPAFERCGGGKGNR
ncbi:MAG TPA: hypothetical protein PKE69_21765 [Pyrinomonadaceae bacterium]|nr:hypothetical protein [Pyrinomonadaceae bacterium]